MQLKRQICEIQQRHSKDVRTDYEDKIKVCSDDGDDDGRCWRTKSKR